MPTILERPLSTDFFAREVETVARALIGTTLLVDGIGGTIVETEAYHASEPASHCFRGRTRRNASMFGPPGHAYVYQSYGIHWGLNFVCAAVSGVLIRAIEPVFGLDSMVERRGLTEVRLLCAGPGRLCQALAVDRSLDGHALDAPPFQLFAAEREVAVSAGPRIGITRAIDMPWRFCRTGSRFLSHPA